MGCLASRLPSGAKLETSRHGARRSFGGGALASRGERVVIKAVGEVATEHLAEAEHDLKRFREYRRACEFKYFLESLLPLAVV
jgi:hypothetical protein